MKQKSRGMGVGTVSLIMIFSVLCLTVFAMLTLSTSNAEKVLADRTASFIKGYYEADSLATEVMADLIAENGKGNFPETVRGVEIIYEQSDSGATLASFICYVTDVQDLAVVLNLEKDRETVMQWKTEYSQDWGFDDSIFVWDGDLFTDIVDINLQD